MLDINFGDRENFAYACEAYSRIIDLAGTVKDRQILVNEIEKRVLSECWPPDDRVDSKKYIACLLDAVNARTVNLGWKKILEWHSK